MQAATRAWAPIAGQATETIRDLASLLAGMDVPVGLVVRPPGVWMPVADQRSALAGELIWALDRPSSGTPMSDTIYLLRCDSDRAAIRLARRRAVASGTKTCLWLSSSTPIPAILREFHEGHEYALVRWDPGITERFVDGLDSLARETDTSLIAANLGSVTQVRHAVAAGVRHGVVSQQGFFAVHRALSSTS